MRKRRIIVMGFMASCPIAGVVWAAPALHSRTAAAWTRRVLCRRIPLAIPTILKILRRARIALTRFKPSTTLPKPLVSEVVGPIALGSRSSAVLWDASTTSASALHEADAVLNICGAQELHEDLLKNQHLIYVESDPGVEQIYVDLGDEKALTYLGHHQTLFTFGENIGSNSFPVPLHGLRWLPTRQPVVIDFWETESAPAKNAVFSTIANWSTRGEKGR